MDEYERQDDCYVDELEIERIRKSGKIVCAFSVIVMASWSLIYILTQPIQSKVEFVLYSDDFGQICISDECVKTSATLKSSIEPSVDPCEDFFQFSCGKWLQAHNTSSVMEITDDILDARIENMLKSPRSAGDVEIIKQVQMLYKSCTNKDVDDSLPGIEVFKRFLKELGLPTIPRVFTNDDGNGSVNWIKSEIGFQKMFSDGAFLKINRNYFVSNAITMTVKYIESFQDNYPDYDTYENFDDFGEGDVEEYLRSISITPDEEKIDIVLSRLKEFKENLFSNAPGEEESAEKTYAIDSFEESLTAAGIAISDTWKECISYLKDPIFSNYTHVSVNLKQVNAVFKLISNSDGDLVEFFLWINVMKTVKYHYMASSSSYKEPCKSCLCQVKMHMGFAITYGLEDDYLNEKARDEMKTMIKNILEVYRDVLKTVYSSDKEKLDYLIGKMEVMDLYLGYPDWVSDLNKLEEHYKKINLSSTDFKGNILQLKYLVPNFEQDQKIFEGMYDPMVNNAFYNYKSNAIVFPMGTFAFPLYHLGLTSLNYGSSGFTVGHEITHAMDDTAGLSENSGVIDCIHKQYETQYGEGATHDAVFKEHDNLADTGGIYLSFEAYRRYKTNTSLIEKKLIGFQEYTAEQLFFISYAYQWCGFGLENPDDPHSSDSYRVVAPLKNSHEFSEAFNCPLGSGMNPDRIRCTLI